MIILVTISTDPHTDLIVDALREKKIPFFRYNTDLANEYCTEISINGGSISNPKNGKSIKTDEIRGVWLRRRMTPKILNDTHKDYCVYLEEQWQLFTGVLLASMGNEINWVNHPLALESAKNKLRQLRTARSIGLNTPDTWFTNSPDRLLNLTSSLKRVLYKQLSSGVIKEGEKAIYSNIIEQGNLPNEEIIKGLNISPGIFQPYIEKKYELRVTVVGDEVFTARINSQNSNISRTDWRRYDFENVSYEATTLPLEVERKCVALLKELNITYGAVDMIVTPKDEYVFLEVNANGQWAWVEMLTGLQISRGIVDALSRGCI